MTYCRFNEESILSKFLNRKKNKEAKTDNKQPEYDYLSKDEYEDIYNEFKRDYNDAIKLARPLIRNQKAFSIAPFEFVTIPSTSYSNKENYMRLIDWDLWKFYKNPRLEMEENGAEEFVKVYNSIVDGLKEFASKRGYTIDDGGDWDGGCIILVKKGHAYCLESANI